LDLDLGFQWNPRGLTAVERGGCWWLLRVRWFVMAGSGAGKGWVAGGIDGYQPDLSCLLEDVVDAVEYSVKLSHGG